MAKKISSSDLFEQEDFFKGVRDSASKTIEVLKQVQTQIVGNAKELQTTIKNSSTDSTKGLKEFSAAATAASKVMQDSAIVAEKIAKAEQQQLKADQELVKLQKLKAQEIARVNKEAEKAAKLAANEASAYSKLSKELSSLKRRYSDLAVQNQENTAEGKELLDTITKLDSQLKKVDATVGNHYRNVGNYGEATKSLKLQLRELTQALQNMDESDPRFQQMAQQAGELRDKIQDTQAVVKATAGTAIENLGGAMATAGQVGIAAFQGIESAMVLAGVESEAVVASIAKLQALAGLSSALGVLGGIGDQLTKMTAGFQAFGSKAIGAFNGMTTAGKAFAVTGIGLIITALGYAVANWDKVSAALGRQTAAQRVAGEVTKQATASIINELSAADKLSKQLKDETLTRAEKIKKVKEFQASYPGLLQNMNLESMSIDQINTQLTKNIELLKLQAEAKAIEAIRADKLQKKINIQLDELSGRQENATNWTINYGESAANGWLGFSSAAENASLAQQKFTQIQTVGTKQIDKDINALDKQSTEIDKKIALMQKNGAQSKEAIKDYSKLSAAGGGYNQTLQEQVDLLSQIQDEQIKAIKDENQRAQTQLIVDAERRKNEVTKTVANAQQKAALIKEIEANLITDLDKLDAEYYQKKEQDEKDIQRRLEDEKMAIRDESRKKELDALALEYKRKLEDAKVELKDDKEKASKIAALEKQYQENIRKGIYDINQKWDAIDKQAEDKLVADMIAEDQKQYDAAKKIRDAETALMDEGIEKQKKLIENAYQDELWSLQNQLDEKKITQEQYDKLTTLAIKKGIKR